MADVKPQVANFMILWMSCAMEVVKQEAAKAGAFKFDVPPTNPLVDAFNTIIAEFSGGNDTDTGAAYKDLKDALGEEDSIIVELLVAELDFICSNIISEFEGRGLSKRMKLLILLESLESILTMLNPRTRKLLHILRELLQMMP